MMKNVLVSIFFISYSIMCNAQGRTYNWLLGYQTATDAWTTSKRARLHFDSLNYVLIPETKKMPFNATQANISDENGNLLMATNGCWIANATGDTMMNGGGLNPGPIATNYCKSYSGIPIPHGDLILPYPGDTAKYFLFHQTSNYNLNYLSSELYYTVIDMTQDNGLGGVDSSQKNVIIFQDTLSLGITACKHANGRDWWIIALKDRTDIIYKILLTPFGISSISTQSLGVPITRDNATQPTFSQNGNKFAYSFIDTLPVSGYTRDIRLFDFDRCSGLFSNPRIIDISDSLPGLGLAFSPNSKYLYACSIWRVFQINTDSAVMYVDTVALWDGYSSPNPPFYTHFWTMYLAANGKIYISTDYSTLDLHVINYPDSADTACDVQQHSLHMPCYVSRADVNHPNYYLGRIVGSPCDTIQWSGIAEQQHDFHFSLSPNPSNGYFRIMYLLPQNKKGVFEMFDVEGRKVFSYNLPQWSTLQTFDLKNLSNGVYYCVLLSGNERVSKKIAVIKQ